MNFPIICRFLSAICFAIAVAFGVSLLVELFYPTDHDFRVTLSGFGVSIVVAVCLGALFTYWGRGNTSALHRKEALAAIGLGWLVACAVGSVPYLLILKDCSIANAIFESTSGLTTTGASVFTNLESWPRGLLFWRCLSQWLGGAGVVVFFVAILSSVGAGARFLFSNESSAQVGELDSRVRVGVMRIFQFYLVFSGACAAAYLLAGMDLYDAVCHMFTTVSTGGFSTYSDSVAAFDSPAIEWASIVFMMIGGTSFIFMLKFVSRDWENIRVNTEVYGYYFILILATFFVAYVLYESLETTGVEETLRTAMFQVVSIMTTTGYATVDFNQWLPVTHSILVVLMIIGGCSGSTSAGIKVIRFILALKMIVQNVEKAFRPHVLRNIRANGRNLDGGALRDVLVYNTAIMATVIVGVLLLGLFEPDLSFEGAFSATIACLFNVGPGFYEVGPTKIYDPFEQNTKFLLSLLMIMGRLELFAILVLFVPSFWRRFY